MPELKRWVTLAAVIVVAVLVISTPATANHLVTKSEHDTDTDFENAATLTNLSIVGSGSSAVLEFEAAGNDTVTTNPHDGTTTTDSTSSRGVLINVTDTVREVSVNISSQSSGNPDSVYLMHDNRSLIETVDGSGNTATFSTTLQPGYYLIEVNNTGSDYTHSRDASDGEPYTGTRVDILNGSSSASDSSPDPWNIRNITYEWGHKGDGEYVSDTHDVGAVEEGVVDIPVLQDAEVTAEWQAYDGSNWNTVASSTTTSSGTLTTDLSGNSETQWRVNVTVSATGSEPSFEMDRDAIRVNTNEPQLDNSSAAPSGNEAVTSDPIELSINVSDPDFDTPQGDEVTIEWYVNGSLEGTTTHTQNETATLALEDPPTGDAQWHAEATDSDGHTNVSDTFLFQTPDELDIWEETEPNTRVKGTDVNVTVRFYQETNDTVIERSATDGNVSMSGLPVDEEFIVTVEANGYEFRRVIIDSLLEQQDVFLLPDSATSSRVEFELDDRTNQFDPVNTRLYVSRALNQSNNTRYRVIAGDRFGASSSFPVILEEGARYRLRIESDDGDVRTLGAYTVSGDANPVLQVGQFGFDYSGNRSYEWTAKMETTTVTVGGEEEERDRFVWQYSDPEGETDSLNLTVHERNNASNVLVEKTYTNLGNASYSETLSENQTGKSWVVKINGSRGDQQVQGQALVGANDLTPGIGLDSWWQQVFAVFGLFILAGVVGGGVRAEAGAIVVCLTAGVLYYMSWLPGDVSAGMILAALFIAVLYRVKSAPQVGV